MGWSTGHGPNPGLQHRAMLANGARHLMSWLVYDRIVEVKHSPWEYCLRSASPCDSQRPKCLVDQGTEGNRIILA